MRKFLIPISVVALALTGCGGGHKPSSPTARVSVPAYLAACPQAANGNGKMGICSPRKQLGLLEKHNPPATGGGSPLFEDLSNNDPCNCGQAIKAKGHSGLIVKANQGEGFTDWTAVAMVVSARNAGLAVGEYDFDQDYTIREVQLFEARLYAAGITPHSSNTFPAYMDVEYGNFSFWGLVAQVNWLRGRGWRVGMYTGEWYITPHAGCRFPAGLSSTWLSGYPNAPIPCGAYNYNAHQFTDTPIDLSVFLGSRAQFQQFVHAGPSDAQFNSWRRARDSSLRGYYKQRPRCTRPVLTRQACQTLASRVNGFQLLVDQQGQGPACFGNRRQVRASVCQIVRPAIAVWSSASVSSHRWHNVQQERYFNQRIARTLSTSRL